MQIHTLSHSIFNVWDFVLFCVLLLIDCDSNDSQDMLSILSIRVWVFLLASQLLGNVRTKEVESEQNRSMMKREKEHINIWSSRTSDFYHYVIKNPLNQLFE